MGGSPGLVRRQRRRLGRLLRRDDGAGRRRGPPAPPESDRRGLRDHRRVPGHDHAGRLPGHARPVRVGRAHDGTRPVSAHRAGPGRPLAAGLGSAAAPSGRRRPARDHLAGAPGPGRRVLAEPGRRPVRDRDPGHADRRLGGRVRHLDVIPLPGGARPEAAGHGPLDARAPAPVGGRAVRLGGRDGRLVGRAPAAGAGHNRRPRGLLRAQRPVAGQRPMAAYRRTRTGAVPGRVRAQLRAALR